MESGNHEVTGGAALLSSGQLLAELHAKIRAEKLGSDAMLGQIVEAARILTRAQGAAIAMRQDESVLCMARAGSMAPTLGSELRVDSGISGQCLRTGAPLCCDDTREDPRVDPEVCGRLGLRSLAVAPVGKWPGVSGILEVFSDTPHAFKDAEVQVLAELADLVEVSPRASTQPTVLDAPQKIPTTETRNTSSALRAGLILAEATRKWSNGKLVLAAVIFIVLISWLGLRVRAARPSASAAGPSPRTVGALPVAASSADVAREPSTLAADAVRPSPVVVENTKPSVPGGVLKASTTPKTRPSEPAISQEPQPEAASAASASPQPVNLTSPPPQPTVDVAVAPPLDIVPGDGNAVLKGVLSPVTAPPVLPAVRSSTGVSGGTVERQVQPIYPAEALRLRRSGRIILQAVITKEGTVRGLKLISGDSLLARAAMDAVAGWRYQPYMLNGQPIQRTTEITIEFKLP